jgi:hypothetical protein
MIFDTLLFAQVLTMAADWHQTRDIVNAPVVIQPAPNGQWKETVVKEGNPLLGPHPDAGRINRYFLLEEAAVLGAAHWLPEYRTQILGASVVVELAVTTHNASIGLRAGW